MAPTGTTTETLAPAATLRAVIDFPDTCREAAPGDRLRARFDQPIEVIEAWTTAEVLPAIERVQAHAAAGRWCLGGLAYEAAGAFDAALVTHTPDPDWPLAWFGIYTAPLTADAQPCGEPGTATWSMTDSRAHYLAQVERAQQAMAAGDCYQVNLTSALTGHLSGDPSAWMHALRQRQPDGYLLWLDGGNRHALSASPELFFDWCPAEGGGKLSCRPMKGTAAREGDPALDEAARERLLSSPKEQAENVMIVDLLRNDLSRIAQPGSVRVDGLMEAEAWPTVWQMTSRISARARPDIQLTDVLHALFPCGSITGAPKAQSMHWITRLERGPRGFYCGTLGVVRPGGHATFNVPIRTLTLQRPQVLHATSPWHARYGVGSGLTVYADPASEWEELITKSQLLHRVSEPFCLLETMRVQDGVCARLDRHLRRLQHSARHFAYPFDRAAVQEHLNRAIVSAHAHGLWRVRMSLSAQGVVDIQFFTMTDTPQPVRVALAPQPLSTNGALREFIHHKTTRRAHYEALAPTDPTVFDHLLFNERGELTEFTRGNLAVLMNGQWLTPAHACGLLGGTYRAELLDQRRLSEAVVTISDLKNAQGLAFFNGLRGWLTATLVADEHRSQAAALAPVSA